MEEVGLNSRGAIGPSILSHNYFNHLPSRSRVLPPRSPSFQSTCERSLIHGCWPCSYLTVCSSTLTPHFSPPSRLCPTSPVYVYKELILLLTFLLRPLTYYQKTEVRSTRSQVGPDTKSQNISFVHYCGSHFGVSRPSTLSLYTFVFETPFFEKVES